MRGTQLGRRVLAAMAVAALLAGCGGGAKDSGNSTDSSVGTTTAQADTSDGSDFSSPAVEGSGPESPPPRKDGGPSITVASLPVGGNADQDPENPLQQCASVNWLLGSLPSGVVVRLGDVSFDPSGIFQQGGSGCGSNQPVCHAGTTWTKDGSSCSLPVTQLDESSAADVTLLVPGKISCPSQVVCDQLNGQLTGQTGLQIVLTAIPNGTPSPDASTSSPAEPAQASSSPAGS